jgi:hypothetical protein
MRQPTVARILNGNELQEPEMFPSRWLDMYRLLTAFSPRFTSQRVVHEIVFMCVCVYVYVCVYVSNVCTYVAQEYILDKFVDFRNLV